MGRGYSRTRSGTNRGTKKDKMRKRSLSLGKLKTKIQSIHTEYHQEGEEKESTTTRRKLLGQKRKRSLSQQEVGKKNKKNVKKGGEEEGQVATTYAYRDISDSELEASEDEDERIFTPEVRNKYKTAGQIVDRILKQLMESCIEGADTKTICDLGNSEMMKQTVSVFRHTKDSQTGEKLKKGIAFPTSISINEVICNHAPVTKEESKVLKKGDVVKIHLGVHVDGYPVTAARTILVQGKKDGGGSCSNLSPAVANTFLACICALQGMMRLIRPGVETADITDFIHGVGHHFGVQPLEGVLSHRSKRWVMDGMECIIARRVVREEPQQDVFSSEIGPYQVWNLDVAFTSSATPPSNLHEDRESAKKEGKDKSYKTYVSDEPQNIVRKNEIIGEQPRLQAATNLLGEIRAKFQCFPFHAQMTENPLKSKLGMIALKRSNMLDVCPVMQSRPKSISVRMNCTVGVTETKIHVFCGDPDFAVLFGSIDDQHLLEGLSPFLPSSEASSGNTLEGADKEKKGSTSRFEEMQALWVATMPPELQAVLNLPHRVKDQEASAPTGKRKKLEGGKKQNSSVTANLEE